MHVTTLKHITLSEDPAYKSKFPTYLKEIATTWYSVYYKEDHIGEVYQCNGDWRAFTINVDNVDGTLDGCIKFLMNNR